MTETPSRKRIGVLSLHNSKETKSILNTIEALGHEPVWIREETLSLAVDGGRGRVEPDVDAVVNRLLLTKSDTALADLGVVELFEDREVPVLNPSAAVLRTTYEPAALRILADPDRDGLANFHDTDSDGDGLTDEAEVAGETDPYLPEPDPNRDLWLDGVPDDPDSSIDATDQVGLDPDARMGELLDWIERSGGVNIPDGLFASERVDVRLVADDETTELARGFVVTRGGRVISADHGDGRNPTMRVYVTEGAATRLVDSPDRPRTLQDELDAGTVRYEGIGVVGGLKVTFAKVVYTVWRFVRGFSILVHPPSTAPSG